jgi:glutamate racemase
MSDQKNNILVFDSGVGGLSIIPHIRHYIPSVGISYFADNALFPYGLLDDQQLIDRVVELISSANEMLQPDIIIIACNSASTLALPHLRKVINTPIVGVVPAIKPAAQLSDNRVIGLLATPGTIQRDYTDELIDEFAPNSTIIRVGTSELVDIVEKKLAGEPIAIEALDNIISPFQQHDMASKLDTMVLACTHFPLIQTELAAALPRIKHWVDSGDAIARRVTHLISTTESKASTNQYHTDTAFFTTTNRLCDGLVNSLNHFGLPTIKYWQA